MALTVNEIVRFEVLTAVRMSMFVLWVVTQYGLEDRHQILEEIHTASIFRQASTQTSTTEVMFTYVYVLCRCAEGSNHKPY
jgi:hypothetical protein